MKAKITPNILELKNALEKNGISVNLDSYATTCIDGKQHFCTFLETDFFCYEDTLSFVFHPQTGKLVSSCLDCPIERN